MHTSSSSAAPSPHSLLHQNALIVGGSRGLGLGLAEALGGAGAKVTVLARGEADLEAARARLGVSIRAGEATDPALAAAVLAEVRPSLLVLNAGAVPRMAPLDEISWADFSVNWESDVRIALVWLGAALRLPLPAGARVLVVSSGAAVHGSRLSGGYGGAKRMVWLLADYAHQRATERGLGLRFQVVVPQQMVAGTGVGEAGANAYRAGTGLGLEEFLAARFGPPLSPRAFGEQVVALLTEPQWQGGFAFGLQARGGISTLEEAA